jgi:hypothetical protein
MTDRQSALHSPPPPPVGPASGRPNRGPLLIAVAVLAGVALIASGVWLTRGTDEEATEGEANRTQAIAPHVERAYVAEVRSALRNGVTAMEVYAVDHSGDYSGATIDDLTEDGLVIPAAVTLTTDPTSSSYCIAVTHADLPDDHPWKTASLDSDMRAPSEKDTCSN